MDTTYHRCRGARTGCSCTRSRHRRPSRPPSWTRWAQREGRDGRLASRRRVCVAACMHIRLTESLLQQSFHPAMLSIPRCLPSRVAFHPALLSSPFPRTRSCSVCATRSCPSQRALPPASHGHHRINRRRGRVLCGLGPPHASTACVSAVRASLPCPSGAADGPLAFHAQPQHQRTRSGTAARCSTLR